VVVRLQIGFNDDGLGSYKQTEMSKTIITPRKLWGRKQVRHEMIHVVLNTRVA
jgi:hypothetical protein